MSATAEGRQTPPRQSRQQRATLESVVAAVDRAAVDATLLSPSRWQVHVLRASDGSHYVALRGVASGLTALDAPVILYVRLTSRAAPGVTTVAQRSAVMEWLRGQRSDPLPMSARPLDVGAAGRDADWRRRRLRRRRRRRQLQRAALHGPPARAGGARARGRRQEAPRRARDAARAGLPTIHPFEDFEVAARLDRDAAGATILRSVRAGPGAFDLYVAWAEPAGSGRPGPVRVITRRLELPAATTDFQLSDIVLADARPRGSRTPTPPASRTRIPTPSARSKRRRPATTRFASTSACRSCSR